ncbi:MAG: hypothetical protein NT118_06370, partial [Lentisphaerae bacterium]|nr:hypothetical protein [Lentisphaerota bacterium]
MKCRYVAVTAVTLVSTWMHFSVAADAPASAWKIGAPIVTYWAGPGYPGGSALNDVAAVQLSEGGWNLVWCNENELDVVQRHGLRGLIVNPLLTPAVLDDPKQREALDAFIARVRKHPAFYAYHLIDEPSAGKFPELGKLVAYLRERDPDHLAYINILPTYANNEQLGTAGDMVKAYTEHLRQYVEIVRPSLLSYDHYQFTNKGDNPQYFLNLALIREKALSSGLPFMNIVQASCWVPGSSASPEAPRVPNGDEMRYLVYTTLAYGAQGISYYVYCYPQHEGGIAQADGTPTVLYHALKLLNREFAAIAKELQPLKSLDVFHTGMLPPGTKPLPKESAFTFDPPVPAMDYKSGDRVQGVLISSFGSPGKTNAGTYVLVVNLDYKAERTVFLKGPSSFEVFDAATGKWS